jgi:iron(III) transport system permease protein
VARARQLRAPAPIVFGTVVALVVSVLPVLYLLVRASERGWAPIRATLWRRLTLDLATRSVLLAVTVTAACVVIGVGGAWLVTRTDVPFPRLWRVVLSLPLAVPSYVAAWAWLGLRSDLSGLPGAFVVLTSVSFPYVYLPVAAALRRGDPELEDAARLLGRRPAAVFFTVTLRQARTAAVGGALLVGLYALSDFGAVSIMRYPSLTQAIYRSYRASFDRTPAAVLGCLLVLMALVVLVAQRRVAGSTPDRGTGSGVTRQIPTVRLGIWRWPAAAALAAVTAVSLGVPGWSLLYWLERGTSRTDWSTLADATFSTGWIAAVAAVLTVLVAIPVGVLSARHGGALARWATNAAYAAHALPGIVIALSLVFFGVRVATPLYQRIPMLLFAYVVLFLSLAVAAVHNSVAQAPPVLEEMSRTLGRGQWATWREVTLRLAAPGLGAAALLVFLTVMKELPATLLLRPIGVDTLATRLWGYTDAASFAAAAPYAAVIVVLAAVPAVALTGAWTDGGAPRRRRRARSAQ